VQVVLQLVPTQQVTQTKILPSRLMVSVSQANAAVVINKNNIAKYFI